MADNKKKETSHETEVEMWARALDISPNRLIALVDEVVNERLPVCVSVVPAKVPIGQQ